jgi:hypothetical protein
MDFPVDGIMISNEEIKKAYSRFFDARFATPEQFWKEYMTVDYLFIIDTWHEEGVTFVLIGDNNMWDEIVVIDGIFTKEEVYATH